jgi:MFS family permease
MSDTHQSNYKWYILALSIFIGAFVAAMPFSCMPALFKEISEDLGLSLVQVGTVWGMSSLAGIFVSLIGGILSDRFNVRLFLGIACILVGVTGALRGLSSDFLTLMVTVFINGIVRLIVPINITKTVGIWFKGKYLGMALGISAMGMGLGLMLGPMISATILSPLLGGWRNVMYFYGAISVIMGIIWLIFGREPVVKDSVNASSVTVPIRQALSKLLRNKGLRLIGVTLMFRTACIMGMTGYLPLYLREQGWTAASADGTLSAFYAASTLCVVPLSIFSDRIGSRKVILFPALVVTLVCLGILPVMEGVIIWILMILSGIFMDAFMAINTTMLMEIEGISSEYSGMALGIIFTIAQIGSTVSPPLGNSLASIDPGLPFIFWASLSIVSLFTLTINKETGRRRIKGLGK